MHGKDISDFVATRVDAFVDCLERLDVRLQVVDERELPYPREEILEALCLLVSTGDRTERRLASLLTLAQFQRGVGKPAQPSDARFYRHRAKVQADIVRFGDRYRQAAAFVPAAAP